MSSLRTVAAGVLGTAGSVRYGLVAQTFSSATNFGLVVIAGHVLGPSGVGTLFVGLPAYFILLGLLQALVTTPLVAASSGSRTDERAVRARSAVTLAFAGLVPVVATVATIGFLLPAELGRGMLLIAPWLLPAVIQDLGRSIIFRDRSGASTLASDAVWLLAMAAALPFVIAIETDWSVVACWGMGAVCACVVVLMQIRWRPIPLLNAIAWWKAEASHLGRWLLLSGSLYHAASYGSVLALVSILSPREFGGLRAVQTAFAPLSLLGPALSLPGLPMVSRLIGPAPKQALLVAGRLGSLIMILTVTYVVVLYSFPDLLRFLFGEGFTEFRSIVVPIGVSQVLLAPIFGLTLFLKAQQRGRTLFWLASLYTLLNVSIAVLFAAIFGLQGAAWATAIAALVYVATIIIVIRPRRLAAPVPDPIG